MLCCGVVVVEFVEESDFLQRDSVAKKSIAGDTYLQLFRGRGCPSIARD